MEILIPIGLIVIGVLLIIVEVYLIPGFNVAGIAGAVVMFFAIGYAFNEAGTVGGLVAIISAVVLTGGSFMWMWKSGAWNRFVLSTNLARDEGAASRESEYRAQYLGKTGVAMTPLRPTGVAEIEGDRIEVVTEGDFIAAGSRIKVVAMDRRKYFVRLVTDSSGEPAPTA